MKRAFMVLLLTSALVIFLTFLVGDIRYGTSVTTSSKKDTPRVSLRRNLLHPGSVAPNRNLTRMLTVNQTLSTPKLLPNLTSSKPRVTVLTTEAVAPIKQEGVHFVIIQCQGSTSDNSTAHKDHIREHWDHQMRQMKVLFKSMAFLTTTKITIHLVTDSENVYDEITAIPESWPLEYSERLIFGPRREAVYPASLAHIRNMFCRCCTARLFLADILHDLDSVIFLDTDTLFMQPPEGLWDYFQNFDNRQVAGVTPCLYMYNDFQKALPHFGFSGLNAGVMLLNLTRIRTFPGGWVPTISKILKDYKKQIKFADQDILNVVFSGRSEAFAYEVECHWNFRLKVCSSGRNRCPDAAANGVALLHGCATTFVNQEGPKIKAVFEAWEKFDLRQSKKRLLSLMQNGLHKVKSRKGCTMINNIDDILVKGLKHHLIEQT